MNLIPRRALTDFDELFDFWRPMRSTESASGAFSPRVDIKDMKDHYEISAELPGVEKKDLDVRLENGVLTISAESKDEKVEEKDGKVIRQERRYGKFVRSFDLGADIKETDVAANFKDGILTLTAPKHAPKAAEAKRIEIK
ncbi:MAG: Hsp20/alpha crystallin family protein [Gammaproteobacteria bacterium]